VFDTETLGVTVCPPPRSRRSIRGCRPSVGHRLVAFASPYVEVLGPEPPPGGTRRGREAVVLDQRRNARAVRVQPRQQLRGAPRRAHHLHVRQGLEAQPQ
jgi:hypothetical protein